MAEGFNIHQDLGAHVSIAAALELTSSSSSTSASAASQQQALRPDRKWVLKAGALVPAGRGAPVTSEADQERMWQVCRGWMDVWRAHAASAAGAGGI